VSIKEEGQKPVLEATDRKAVCLIVGIAVDSSNAGIQVPVPRISASRQRRPKVPVRPDIVKSPISIAVAGQKALAHK